MAKLTDDEHHARAMLMQLEYLPWANAYVDNTKGGPWIDADTLEQIGLEEASIRIQRTIDTEPYKDLYLDWATTDGR